MHTEDKLEALQEGKRQANTLYIVDNTVITLSNAY